MQSKELKCAIEAILFTMGESVSALEIAKALEVNENAVIKAIEELSNEYESEKRGFRIIKIENSYQMCTSKDAYQYLIKLVSIPKNYKLSETQLEVLSIIAYKQPITRVEIEKIRGVSSDYMISRLVEAGLIEEAGRLDAPGRPIQFATSEEFLRRFGLDSLSSLPDIDDEQVEIFKTQAEEEIGFITENEEEEQIEGQMSLFEETQQDSAINVDEIE